MSYGDLTERKFQEILTEAKARALATKKQLDFWPNDKALAPAILLRSSVFGVVRKVKNRPAVMRKKLASWAGTEIVYTGFRLDQADLDIYLALIDLQKDKIYGVDLITTERQLLKSTGRSVGGKDIKWLRDCISRLTACEITLVIGEQEYFGPLIVSGQRNTDTGELCVVLHPKMAEFFSVKVWQDKGQRLALKSDLAKWLLGYISSHTSTVKKPHIVHIETLMKLCGTEQAEVKHFKAELKKALEALREAKAVVEWGIALNGNVEIVKGRHADPRGKQKVIAHKS